MKFTKKILSLLLALTMVLTLLPATAFATGTEEDVVYLSVSFDDKYIDDTNGDPIMYVPVPLETVAAVDLAEYGLDNMLFDADDDGEYETTALQLLIYAHEELYGGDWSEVTFYATPGSSYFAGGIFGFTENLMYFHNGDFPVDETQTSEFYTVGATSDRIVLEAGDFLDVASFGCYAFLWDTQGGFHLFGDADGNYTHDYTAEAGEALSVKLIHSFCDLMSGTAWTQAPDEYEVFYGSVYGEAEGSVFTDEEGCAEITFDTASTYYVWCYGGNGADDGTHGGCDYCLETGEPCIVSSPAFAKVTVSGAEEPQQPCEPQDVSDVLDATMAQLAATVTAPAFGTSAGEWTVFGLARGGYYESDSTYFADYYDRIVATVNEKAASVNMNGALDANKSTDNSRLIMALSAIGRDATSVGNWDLVEAYSANGINWIKKQGLNGTIWTLIALDCGDYETSDPTIRQQCVDAIVAAQHDDGGWSLVTAKTQPSNVDITGMALTALYPYKDQPAVAAACEEAFTWLSESQLDNGGFPYGTGETSESCVWAIVAATTWGINPDTDTRFIKNGNSAIDNLLTYYVEDEAMFEHGRGAGSNAMATDQATYGLVAYDRFINDEPALYDYSDVVFEENTVVAGKPKVSLGMPAEVTNDIGFAFDATIAIDQWDNDAGYKLIDFIVSVPEGIDVTSVSAGSRLKGGAVQYHLEANDGDNGKLRIVYFDANENSDLTIVADASGNGSGANLFTIGFKVIADLPEDKPLSFAITGMSLKKSSDSTDEDSMIEVSAPEKATEVNVVAGVSFAAAELYVGDGVDLIPTTKKAVAVFVTGLKSPAELTYTDGTNTYAMTYSPEMKNGDIHTYVALVAADIEMECFVEKENYKVEKKNAPASSITFGNLNTDDTINAQDALNAVNFWLRKGDAPTDAQILAANVNGDARLNTFDALGIVESFVNDTDHGVVTKALTAKPVTNDKTETNN